MSLKAVLFDLDGTLINSLPLILYASRRTHEEMSIPYDEEYFRSTIGLPIVKTAADIAAERAEEYLEIYSNLCNKFQDELITLYPNTINILEEIREHDLKIAIVTSRRRFSTESILKSFDLDQYFSACVCVDDTEKHKPAPEPALLALSQLDVTNEYAAMVGDSPYDINCGNAAGCITAGVTWGMADKATLKQANPNKIFDDALKLSKWLLRL